jgi:hypothetical protein
MKKHLIALTLMSSLVPYAVAKSKGGLGKSQPTFEKSNKTND